MTKQKAAELRTSALARLAERYRDDNDGASLDDALAGEPEVTPILRAASGGLPAVLTALRSSADEDAQAFVAMHDSLRPAIRKLVSWEVIAVAAGLTTTRLREVAFSAVCDFSDSATNLLLKASMPRIVRKSVAMALTDKGLADREWMLKAGTVLPTPKAAQTLIQRNVLIDQSITSNELPPAPDTRYIEPDERLRAIHGMWGQNNLLPASSDTHAEIPKAIDDIQKRTTDILETDGSAGAPTVAATGAPGSVA